MTTTIEQLTADLTAATEALNAVNRAKGVKVAEATRAIEAEFRDQLVAASAAAGRARIALHQAEQQAIAAKAANHPLAGRKVSAMRELRGKAGWSGQRAEVFGIIEVITEAS